MNYTFSDNIASVKPSAIREILKLVAANPSIISLSTGSPSSEAIPVDAIHEISEKLFREKPIECLQYNVTEGYAPLRQITMQRLHDSFGIDPEGNEFIYLRDKCLPLIRLGSILKLENSVTDPTEGICIYCREGRYEAVLLADKLVCDQQVVVKPFSPLLDGLHLKEAGLAGSSILGDGSMTIILDMNSVLNGETGEEGANG